MPANHYCSNRLSTNLPTTRRRSALHLRLPVGQIQLIAPRPNTTGGLRHLIVGYHKRETNSYTEFSPRVQLHRHGCLRVLEPVVPSKYQRCTLQQTRPLTGSLEFHRTAMVHISKLWEPCSRLQHLSRHHVNEPANDAPKLSYLLWVWGQDTTSSVNALLHTSNNSSSDTSVIIPNEIAFAERLRLHLNPRGHTGALADTIVCQQAIRTLCNGRFS